MTTTRSDRYIASSTSCVTITTVLFSRSQIGVFDPLNAARAAANDRAGSAFITKPICSWLLSIFAICFGAFRYSLWLERLLRKTPTLRNGNSRIGYL